MSYYKLSSASVFLLVALLTTLLFGQMTESKEKATGAAKATEFELKDQYNQVTSYRFPKDKVTILIFGDRKGSEQIEGWVRPLWDRYQDRIDQKGVAVLNSVPSFMRGVVRAIFKTQVKHSVLLDWKGDISQAYGYQSGQANLYVIDRGGQIVMKLLGGVKEQELQKLYGKVDQLLSMP